MLSTDPESTRDVVMSEKPGINDDSYNPYDGAFIDELIDQISSLASIYHVSSDELDPRTKALEAAARK